MPLDIEDIPAPEDLHKLLEAAKPELLKVEIPKDMRRLVGRERVADLTDIMVTSWAPLTDWIDEELSPARAEQRKAQLAGLDNRGWVFYAADLEAEEIHSDATKKAQRELAKVVKENDRTLMMWANPIFGSDPDHAATLADIARGKGRRDDAEDVQRLVILYRSNLPLVMSTQKVITEDYLDKAATNAAKQLAYLRRRKKNPARKLADAAYLLWYRDYVDLMQLGRYLTWREADSMQRFPGVQEERNAPATVASAPVQEEDEEVDEEDEEAEAPPQVDENK